MGAETTASALPPSVEGDLPAIERCTRAAYETFAARIGYQPQPVTTDYAPLVDSGRVWVLQPAGEIDGVLVLIPETDHLLLYSIAVAPHRQGEGLGQAMMAFTEARARDLDLAEVQLYTNEMMSENIAYYEARGYVEFDRRPHPTRDGATTVHMRKSVTAP